MSELPGKVDEDGVRSKEMRGMTTQAHDHELESERDYLADLYDRLDARRRQMKAHYRAALGGPIDIQDGGTLVARDAEVRALAQSMARLDVADHGLCFGRLDAISGERLYVGRIGIFDEDNEILLLDWRAPAARAFYIATAANPEGMRRRRQFHSLGRRLVDFTDEVFGRPDPNAGDDSPFSSDAALLAAVNAPRGRACATSWPRSRPSRTRSSASTTRACW